MSPVLALHDGRAGNARQAMALAHCLDVRASECVLSPRAPWQWLAPRRLPGAARAFGQEFSTRILQPPVAAIGCGRQAALATRLLRERGSRCVQILDPRIPARHWELVVAPEHDRLRGDNVLHICGSLNPVDDDYLLRAISAFPELALLPTPHTVLLVGGPTRHAALDDDGFRKLLQQLSARAYDERGSFSAIASRRTPASWRDALGAIDPQLPGLRWRDTGDGSNPYAGLLASADRLICTPDSVNMLSEAAATHAPVFVWSAAAAQGRLRTFLDSLLGRGRIRELDAALEDFEAEPLRETERIAVSVRMRLPLTV